ncbi:ParB N-terminal domain-containing protein [Lignipirellula cremea]|uniref:ParB/Sulfiredoxin domain-containing protein n=1 Tax=Lignipirellula cremea TaxID=2528010 RepID=A0A518E0A7_9BACT|nr:hypothetical protein [Lignipirellula cremea]QDU97518.1 hypothetical protein Pla8534_53660 [Lignipirellula cremea]
MKIRDRIIDFRRVPADQLLPNPKNWRTHPVAQQDALRGILAEVGIADAVLARETPAGLMLIDGHLRADVSADAVWPVLVLDVDDDEADKLLASHDPLAAMAVADQQKLDELLAGLVVESAALQAMFDDLQPDSGQPDEPEEESPEVEIPEMFQVVVACVSEADQADVYSRLTEEGYRCRVLTL